MGKTKVITISQDAINEGIGSALMADYSDMLNKCHGNAEAAHKMTMSKQEARRTAAKGNKKFSIRWGRK